MYVLKGKENTATNGIVQCDQKCDSSANCDTKKNNSSGNTETHGDRGDSAKVVKDNHSGVDHHSDTASQHRQMKLPDIRAKSGKFVRLSGMLHLHVLWSMLQFSW